MEKLVGLGRASYEDLLKFCKAKPCFFLHEIWISPSFSKTLLKDWRFI